MPKNKLKFDVGSVFEREEGSHIDFDIDESVKFEGIDSGPPMRVKTRLRIMKLPHEFNVTTRNFTTEANFVCGRCLAPFKHKISIPLIEREFLFEKPRVIEDINDLYLVDMKNMTIDLTELFRQEILLHFPLIPLCSLKCKGLCIVCGGNLNKDVCGHAQKQKKPQSNKPMANLKELFNRAFAEGEHSSIEIKSRKATPPNRSQNGKTAGNKEKSSAKPDKKKIQRVQKVSSKKTR